MDAVELKHTMPHNGISALPTFLRPSSTNLLEGEPDEDHYFKGQIIFSMGNTPRGLYFIKSGRVKVFRHGSDGKEQILAILGSGKFLGYKDLLAQRKYSSNVTAIEDATLVFIPKEDFFRIFGSSEGSNFFISLLCQDLIEAERKMVSLAYTPVRGRLAEGLLELNNTYEDHDHKIELSREDLANYIGTAKETVIRLLSEFRSDHLVEIRGKYIEVINPQGLNKLNDLYS